MLTIEISIEEYKKLLKDSYLLELLEEAGVDKWDGYDLARFPQGKISYWNFCNEIDKNIVYKE